MNSAWNIYQEYKITNATRKKHIVFHTHILGSEVADTNIKYHTESKKYQIPMANTHIYIRSKNYQIQISNTICLQEYKGSCSGGDQDMDVTTIVYNSYYQVFHKRFSHF